MAITEWEIYKEAIGQEGVRILLCDDEPAVLGTLREELLTVFARLHKSAQITAFSSPSLIALEQFAACDLAFLDVDFDTEDCNGIDIARRLRQVNTRALIFFVTNYIDYAPEGYEVQAFRYILKRDLREVLERYIFQAMENLTDGKEYLRLKDRDQVLDLLLEQVSYLEVMDHYVSIHAGQKVYTLGTTLSSLEKELEAHGFLRIHKSYLVNMRFVRRFRSRECLLSDGTLLSVSEKNYSQQKQKYLLWKGMQ